MEFLYFVTSHLWYLSQLLCRCCCSSLAAELFECCCLHQLLLLLCPVSAPSQLWSSAALRRHEAEFLFSQDAEARRNPGQDVSQRNKIRLNRITLHCYVQQQQREGYRKLAKTNVFRTVEAFSQRSFGILGLEIQKSPESLCLYDLHHLHDVELNCGITTGPHWVDEAFTCRSHSGMDN